MECRQQYFRVRPQDIEVAEGGTAVIACEVGNREGRVQWTRDGLTLGKDSSLLGELGRGDGSNVRLRDYLTFGIPCSYLIRGASASG